MIQILTTTVESFQGVAQRVPKAGNRGKAALVYCVYASNLKAPKTVCGVAPDVV
jgi:hypothetical protein